MAGETRETHENAPGGPDVAPDGVCQAPRRANRPKGQRCEAAPWGAPCPKWGVACLKHNQHESARETRERNGRGGPKTSAALQETKGSDRYSEAVAALGDLTDPEKAAARAFAETGDVEAAAKRADVDPSDLRGWLATPEGEAAIRTLKRYRPSAVADRIEIAVIEGLDRLATLVQGTDVAGELVGAMKILVGEYAKIRDTASSEELDEIRARLEELEDEQRPH